MPPSETRTPVQSDDDVEPVDERVPVGRYINPLRGIVIGVLVLVVLGLVLGVVMILQPDRPAPAMGSIVSIQRPPADARLPAGEAFSVRFTLGTSDGAPLAGTDVAGLTVHVRSSLTPDATRFESVPCTYRAETGAYTCEVVPPSRATTRLYLTVVEYPNGSGPQVVTVAPTVDASTTNPFVVRFR